MASMNDSNATQEKRLIFSHSQWKSHLLLQTKNESSIPAICLIPSMATTHLVLLYHLGQFVLLFLLKVKGQKAKRRPIFSSLSSYFLSHHLTSFFTRSWQCGLLWSNLWSSWAAISQLQLSSQSAVFRSTCLWLLMS